MKSRSAIIGLLLLSTMVIIGSVQRSQGMDFSSDTGKTITVSSYPVQPDDWGLAAERADVVVLGTVARLDAARWVSQTGERPDSVDEVMSLSSVQVRTPVHLHVERAFKGALDGENLQFSFLGRTVDGLTVQSEELSLFQPGAQMILFLHSGPAAFISVAVGTPLFPGFVLTIEGETAHGPLYDVPASTVFSQIQGEVS